MTSSIGKMSFLALFFIIVTILATFTITGVSSESLRSRRIGDTPVPSQFVHLTFSQYLDHFNPLNSEQWTQYYYIDETRFKPNAPLFIYLGGEGPIEHVVSHSGVSFADWGYKLNALVVYAEHRFYGQSVPSNPTTNLHYLNIEQSLEDFAKLITTLREKYQITTVVTCGGSYPGMLSGYIRAKYPHLVTAAVASSAPYHMMGFPWQSNDVMNYAYFKKVSGDFTAIDQRCGAIVNRAYLQLQMFYEEGRFDELQTTLHTCEPIGNASSYFQAQMWIRQAFIDMAQQDYPDDNESINYPARSACHAMLNDPNRSIDPLGAVAKAISYDYGDYTTLPNQCHVMWKEFTFCVDESGCGGMSTWDWQACTQLIYYPSTNNITDFFPSREHSFTTHQKYCQLTFGTDLNRDYNRLTITFPNIDWTATSNIIFTNGQRDPWCAGGVATSQSDTLLAITIPGAAHHLDLMKPTQNDPQNIGPVRDIIFEALQEMIKPTPDTTKLAKLRQHIDQTYPHDCENSDPVD